MTVFFIGAGPGAADLITVRGRDLLARCAVCLYPGSLTPPDLLAHCPPGAKRIDTADLSVDQIVGELVAADRAGHDVARLCSGDPSIYSAVAEQMRRLDAADVRYEVVPGVPAFAAAAAELGRELTVPTVGQSLVITRVQARSTAMPPGEELATFAASGTTLALHLAINRVEQVVEELLPHYGADCPVAVVHLASQPGQQILRGTLAGIAQQVRAAEITRAAVIFVGRVLAAENFPDSYLYSAARDRSEKLRGLE
ncbi:precorrin-4/cobalt-precorrin-4 C11-methyltransferase [Amycolatopsis bartoniae]|uniref:Precorrin-4 C(11)-methyltransferase n=1 Tax=Amycolatopsis bartoniae TaxID=941986 RepID=A0A8H9IVH5_9PSEU|nr:precorrin-4 C(11)-methyltransferase [Amycolatopsis bartoniae]MBB2934296.1 precorrin-4/cobalt-precorrin-4 C11-methyltransferase [Amycolatopsis bartoniae]TVT08493.1 precorrin-4 C(11)-methyltransferase [Amycolatopsis bartoniae]GHF48400.1 precorrin-4 C(11)-methyltransferase [Amycolatopsis bartoniae]